MLSLNSNQIYCYHTELKAAFLAGSADGEPVGNEGYIADQLDEIAAELGLPYVDSSHDLCDDSIFVFADYRTQRVVLVGSQNGPWAVTIDAEIR